VQIHKIVHEQNKLEAVCIVAEDFAHPIILRENRGDNAWLAVLRLYGLRTAGKQQCYRQQNGC
jgi:hypothetical protein